MGLATVLIVIPASIITATSYVLGKRTIPARTAWNKTVKKRVAATWIVLSQIDSIKMIGPGSLPADKLHQLRESEMKQSVTYRIVYTVTHATGSSTCATPSIRRITDSVEYIKAADRILMIENDGSITSTT
ncbi:hypothetical protein QQS21_000156 [Conoideocrella luteorostrata]|uniref:Uncharacterized protein n=1 Tax=Conoideocrella luteorostrata TaxID=1105319 RepID=A0AAJ0CZ61_9HYPO|nr:hypothetical protein QQS21_000156 [Conoideocrella luteorostrata]